METAKEIMIKAIEAQLDDSSVDELFKEIAFNKMILKGLQDSLNDRAISHVEVGEAWIDPVTAKKLEEVSNEARQKKTQFEVVAL